MKTVDCGYALDQNSEYRSYMEDSKLINKLINFIKQALFCQTQQMPKYFLFGLFDGHGGKFVSEVLQKEFPKIFDSIVKDDKKINSEKINYQLKEAFLKANTLFEKDQQAYECGSTGIAGVIYPDLTSKNQTALLSIANVGDSSAYLFDNRNGYRLSYEHKATDKNEQQRIELFKIFNHFYIRKQQGQIFFNRVQGILAITRAFGDNLLKPYGVTVEPFQWDEPLQLQEQYEFLVIASDGVWDAYSGDDKISLMAEQLQKMKKLQCTEIAKQLLENAKKDTRDNLSIIVIKLQK